jgi:hypothetical protein
MYEFEKQLKKYSEIGLDDPELTPGWVELAREFLTKAPDMDDDERNAADAELTEKFKSMHTEEFIESKELTKVKADQQDLRKKTEKIEKDQRLTDLRIQADKDLKHTDIEKLTKLKEKYAELPDIIKQFDLQIGELKKAAEKAADDEKKKRTSQPAEKSTEEKLKALHGKEVSYQDLKNLGIEPTGDDMEVGNIKLYRRLYFFAYLVDASA